MKLNSKKILYLLMALAVVACKKNNPNDIPVRPLAALTITNVISQGKFVRLNTNVLDSCAINSFKIFTILAGNPSPIKAYASISPNAPYFDQRPEIVNGGIYSLYLTGTHTSPEAVFVKDEIPPYPKAEVVNVRVVNLSASSGPLNVARGSNPSVNLFSNLGYKQVSNFITLTLPKSLQAGDDVFEIRSSSGSLIFTYVLDGAVNAESARHRNITLVIKGQVGGLGTDALGVIGVPHY